MFCFKNKKDFWRPLSYFVKVQALSSLYLYKREDRKKIQNLHNSKKPPGTKR